MPFGSLFSVLNEQNGILFKFNSKFKFFKFYFFLLLKEIILDLNQSINVAVQIAKGMEFLHSLESIYLNFDLNSKHVMVILNSF